MLSFYQNSIYLSGGGKAPTRSFTWAGLALKPHSEQQPLPSFKLKRLKLDEDYREGSEGVQ